LCVDVLEHFEKGEGKRFLGLMKLKEKSAIVVTPKNPSGQKTVNGNVHETHRSKWSKSELGTWGSVIEKKETLMLIIGD